MDNKQSYDSIVKTFFQQISNMVDSKIQKLTQVKSATVHSINTDGTVNIQIPPDTTVYHNIQNQSIYQDLHIGDNVKIIKEGNSLSNMWIIGGFNLKPQISIYNDCNTNATNAPNINNNQIVVSTSVPEEPTEGMIWIVPLN